MKFLEFILLFFVFTLNAQAKSSICDGTPIAVDSGYYDLKTEELVLFVKGPINLSKGKKALSLEFNDQKCNSSGDDRIKCRAKLFKLFSDTGEAPNPLNMVKFLIPRESVAVRNFTIEIENCGKDSVFVNTNLLNYYSGKTRNSPDLSLIGKCSFESNLDKNPIVAGRAFLYLLKDPKTSKYYVAHSISHKNEPIQSNDLDLLGDLPLSPAVKDGILFKWKQHDPKTDREIEQSIARYSGDTGFISSIGTSFYSADAYPECYFHQ